MDPDEKTVSEKRAELVVTRKGAESPRVSFTLPDDSIQPKYSTSSSNTSDSFGDPEAHEAHSHKHKAPKTVSQTKLAKIASNVNRQLSVASAQLDGPTRKDSIAGIEFGDPVLNPKSPGFDFYRWARKLRWAIDETGVKNGRAGFVFKDLRVCGSKSGLHLQDDVLSVLTAPFRWHEQFNFKNRPQKTILKNFEGFAQSGELLVVLGRPGSGCISYPQMLKEFKGEVTYNQEVDYHFPHLTVLETLTFAAAVRTPCHRPGGMSRKEYAAHMAEVMMALFGISQTRNTKVGNDYIRGCSGGERKRVSLAEMALSGSPIACWDNSTRGLDAATALEFARALRMDADLFGTCHALSVYQASQTIYDIFDKALVLYEGRQIYFGPAKVAKRYFEDMGWYCPPRQTTGDFLTSVTNPAERRPRKGYEDRVPRTPDEFEQRWLGSYEQADLKRKIYDHECKYPVGGGQVLREFQASKVASQATHVRPASPHLINIPMQVKYCTIRAYQRLWNDQAFTISSILGPIFLALIIGSIYYDTPQTTSGFFAKGSVLFFAILTNALLAVAEINLLYDQRPIVQKQSSYAFYHPFVEALAGLVSDFPLKFVIIACFNIILYFLAGLRREPSQFFIFFLFSYVGTLTMSIIFRTIAASTKTVSHAMSIAGITVLAIVIYTGFTIPRPLMHPWFKWISWINPIAYAFEALFVNELHGVNFPCGDSQLVPDYANSPGQSYICAVPGAVAGQTFVSGDAFLEANYGYSYSHIWRNLGFLFAFFLFFLALYLVISEFNTSTSSSAEVLVFRRNHLPSFLQRAKRGGEKGDQEIDSQKPNATQAEVLDGHVRILPSQKDIFTWRNVVYDIRIKGEPRRILDHISGWVKPGTLTSLMGVSGAGKTTLLDVLAQRTSVGIVTGDMLVNGKPLDSSFQRKTGYVQQQDLHLATSTVREALRFSALLRQPKTVTKKEKYEYVEDVIGMLNMEEFAEAVVGVPGEGLNVEQRKLLTIGVELAAKPALLLFLDEPTSGLDSQSAWAIVAFLRKLANNGQAVLSTIHQPSSLIFQEFDQLLFLAKGGKTVYFGDIGPNSKTLLEYFEKRGARQCGDSENPAEYILEMVGAGPSGRSEQDWPEVWKSSVEHDNVQVELDRLHKTTAAIAVGRDTKQGRREYAMPFTHQLLHVTIRVFQQYWREPSYVWGKIILSVFSALFIGFSFFQSNNSVQGLQNVIFSVFMLTSIMSELAQQIMPRFVTQRSLYEVRERPSKAYTWKAFIMANILVEIPYQIFAGILTFVSYYYAIFGIQSSQRQGLILLYTIQFFVFTSTFAHMIIAALPDAETAGNVATLLFALILSFNGVLQPPTALPKFWLFMYRVSPLTYHIAGIVATGLHDRAVDCSSKELSIFNPPSGQTCGSYMAVFLQEAGGRLENPTAKSGCQYCVLRVADQYLAGSEIYWQQRWPYFAILWAFVIFNIFAAVVLYYVFRVKRWNSGRTKKRAGRAIEWMREAGYWVRALVVKRFGKTPEGKEAVNNRVWY
ncbi:MAG: hypothetical protein M1819_003576 [Sarea resinae]|nr:MAG: hypothetical protein M1819_003576 [Sarea resinae]